MFQDPFERTTDSPMAPAEVCFAITPSDVLDLPRATKAIYVGLSGDVALSPVRGDTPVVFKKVNAGTILDVRWSAAARSMRGVTLRPWSWYKGY